MTIESDQILKFIRREVPPPYFVELSLATDLRKDLRMIEEDAEALMVKFFERFHVAQGDFDFGRYFPPEGSPFSWRWKGKPKAVPLTIEMLARAADAGIWEMSKVEGQ